MKKFTCILLTGLIAMPGAAGFAQESMALAAGSEAPNVKIESSVSELSQDEEKAKFEIVQRQDEFDLILVENPSTGYAWSTNIQDANQVLLKAEDFEDSESGLIGAPGKKKYTFEVTKDGVSTVTFTLKRPWLEEEAESLRILVYKSGSNLIVEEDKLVSIADEAGKTGNNSVEILYNGVPIKLSEGLKKIGEITMMPAADVLRGMGYSVEWKEQTGSVEISKGAQWTSITIGSNSYFKNKMAPIKLSMEPVIMNDRAYVPLEFIPEIIGKSTEVESGKIKFSDNQAQTVSGYVKGVQKDEAGTLTITLTSVKDSNDINNQTVIHTSSSHTYYNVDVNEGEFVNVVCSQAMTMSIPPQTTGYIVYRTE